MTPFVSRERLACVLTSLLQHELKTPGQKMASIANTLLWAPQWPENLRMGGSGSQDLACDSLDLLRLAAAANEMFHLYEAGQELDLLSASTFGDWLDRIEESWRQGVKQITFRTSGSTGPAKRVTHDFSYLQTEIKYLVTVFGDRKRIVAQSPMHHIYGFLFSAMLPDALGQANAAVGGSVSSHDGRKLRDGDLIVSFPDRWEWILRTVSQWPRDVAGVVSTAPCPSDLAEALITRGLGSMTEIYGSTETGGIGMRRWPEPRFYFMPYWKVQSSCTENGPQLLHDSGQELALMDRVEIDEDGSFRIIGRMDLSVQVGGTNVFPDHIGALLRSRPGVRDAMVRMGERGHGSRLEAFVVAEPWAEPTELQQQLEAWIGLSLRSVERPTSITINPASPKTV